MIKRVTFDENGNPIEIEVEIPLSAEEFAKVYVSLRQDIVEWLYPRYTVDHPLNEKIGKVTP